jgi:hypothetical protein
MHGSATPRPITSDPKAARIAALSEEYLSATRERQEEIGEEICGLISGNVVAIRST